MSPKMNEGARCAKIVAWSDEDCCYVGSAPGLIYGGCHGDDERAVFDEHYEIVGKAIALYKADGRPLPAATTRIADALAMAAQNSDH